MSPTNYIGGLTKRQLEVIGGVCRGLADKEIGAELEIATTTVRNTLQSIYRKLGIPPYSNCRHEAIMWAIKNGLYQARDRFEEAVEIVNSKKRNRIHRVGAA